MIDVQMQSDDRGVALDAVGVCGFMRPVLVRLGQEAQPVTATFEVSTPLASHQRGTHMSRLILAALQPQELTPESLIDCALDVARRLEVSEASVKASFLYFVTKEAPASKMPSPMNLTLTLEAWVKGSERGCDLVFEGAVQTLCPCSKAISTFGAHNQRAQVRVELSPAWGLSPEQISDLVDAQASTPLYALLKRPDEKEVTEGAFANPKFVEDIARDTLIALREKGHYRRIAVRAQSAESIHNHDAFACARWEEGR